MVAADAVPRWRELLSKIQAADPVVHHAARMVAEERLRAVFMADPAWWEVIAPALAEAFDPLLDEYGTYGDGSYRRPFTGSESLRSAPEMRHDELVVDLVLGAIVQLEVADDDASRLWTLRARRWLGWYLADVERHRAAAVALGVEWAPLEEWPGWELPLFVASPPGELSEHLAAPGCEFAKATRMRVQGALGSRLVARSAEDAANRQLRWADRPWLWCWETQRMREEIAWTDEGDPLPRPVVVPADWVPATGADQYGFAEGWIPGVQLVFEGDDVLDRWSGRLDRYVQRGNQHVWRVWRRHVPVPAFESRPPRPEPVEDLAEVVPIRPERVRATAPPRSEPSSSPAPITREEIDQRLHSTHVSSRASIEAFLREQGWDA